MDLSNMTDNGDGTYTDSSGQIYNSDGVPIDGPTTDPYANYTTGQNSGTVDTGTPPPGAVKTDATGTNWLDIAGKVIGPVLVGGASALVSPWLSNLQSGGLLNTATGMLTSSGQALSNIQAPDLTKLIPQLHLQVMQGQMTPAQAAAAIQAASGMNSVHTDQASLQGQRDALAKLANVGADGGMTEADRAQLAATMNQTNANVAQQRAAQLQQLQMQGNAGSGAELAARLSGVQGGANSNAMAGANTAQSAQARALAAIQAGLQGNAALNTQQFSQAAQKAQAQDAVNQFNAQAQQSTNLANAGFTQQANANNFNTANTIAGTNTGIQNQQAMMPYEAANTNFKNQLGLGTAQTGAQLAAGKALGTMATNQINRSGALAGSVNNAIGGTTGTAGTGSAGGNTSGGTVDPITGLVKQGLGWVGNNLGTVADTVGGWLGDAGSAIGDLFSDEDLKTDKHQMSDSDIDNMMAQMTAYKYRYKGPSTNPQQVGVMAQDMPQDSVIDTPAGKVIQGDNALGKALAVLANQHDRIKKLEGK